MGNFEIKFDNYEMIITKDNEENNIFGSKITFYEPIEKIVLAAGTFDFSIKNQGFEICRATEEEGCN